MLSCERENGCRCCLITSLLAQARGTDPAMVGHSSHAKMLLLWLRFTRVVGIITQFGASNSKKESGLEMTPYLEP